MTMSMKYGGDCKVYQRMYIHTNCCVVYVLEYYFHECHNNARDNMSGLRPLDQYSVSLAVCGCIVGIWIAAITQLRSNCGVC